MKRCLVLALLAFSATAAEPLTVTKDNVRTLSKGKEFARLTDQPRLVAPLTGLLCRPPGPEILDKEKALVGPHARTMVHYYANAIARDAMAQEAKEFPVGAVFVKEKLAPKEAVLDVGGMVKARERLRPRARRLGVFLLRERWEIRHGEAGHVCGLPWRRQAGPRVRGVDAGEKVRGGQRGWSRLDSHDYRGGSVPK
jgi:hypothetical protein